MADWWNELSTIESIFWLIALISSLFFVVVLIMSFLGGDMDAGDMDIDAEIDADTGIGFQFFTLKNLVGFFTIFGWVGLAMLDSGSTTGKALIVASICGLIMMSIMAATFYFLSKMVSDGTLDVNNAIGVIGEVYLPIGKDRSSIGKIQIKVQGGLRTLDALTDEEEELPRACVIIVKKVVSAELLLVEKLKKIKN